MVLILTESVPYEPLLLAGVSGPLALAAKLLQRTEREAIRHDDLPDDSVELAAETITQIATKLVEAGVNAIFIREEILPVLNQQNAEAWARSLAPAFNIIPFYQAVPTLQITNTRSFTENSAVISSQTWNCILCPTLATFADGVVSPCAQPIGSTQTGIAMPSEAEHFRQSLHNIINEFHPAIITTAADVPAATDVKAALKIVGGNSSVRAKEVLDEYLFRRLWEFSVCIR